MKIKSILFTLLVSIALCNTYVFAENFCCSIGLRTGLDISESKDSGSKVATPIFGVVVDGKNKEQHLGVSAAFDFGVSSDDKKVLDKNKTVLQEKTQASVESLSLNFYYFYTTNNQFEIKAGPTFGVSFMQATVPETYESKVYHTDWDGLGLDLGLAFGIEKIVSRDIILCLDCELQTNIVSSIRAKDVFDTPLSIEYNRAGNAFSILPRFSIRRVL